LQPTLKGIAVKNIYFDVCSLCRPFDDQSFLRIRLETNAVNLILAKVHSKTFQLMASPVHFYEISSITDLSERIQVEMLLENEAKLVNAELKSVQLRTEELLGKGFGLADAAHVAFAESCGADFISCDDRLVKKCVKNNINVWAGSPIIFCDKENLK
jgi:predicted nucleic acid-binding protein